MRLIPITSVTIGANRQRRNFDDAALADLGADIASNSLLHPIVVRQGLDGGYVLVAGERRFKAIEMLALQGGRYAYGETEVPVGQVPVNFLGDLTEAEAEEAELSENIHRLDLSWQDRLEAVNRIARLKELQAGAPVSPYEVGKQIFPDYEEAAAGTIVRRAALVQRHMSNPDVAKAKTLNDALKVIKRIEDAKLNTLLAADVGNKAANELHSVHHADCREWLRDCDGGGFDCILIDPPYGMGADTFGDAAGKRVGIEHDYQDESEYALSLLRGISSDLFRVAKDRSHLYVWCDIDLFKELRDVFAESGWWVFRTPLINVKREGGRVPWPEHGPRRCYELILFAVKGKRTVTSIQRDVFESTLERDTEGHGAAKPVEAYINLLQRSCRPGDTVLDCFAGTGTILSAAHECHMRATAVEADAAYYGQCIKRLESLSAEDKSLAELGL